MILEVSSLERHPQVNTRIDTHILSLVGFAREDRPLSNGYLHSYTW